jgi:hypothetical protein
MFSRPMFFRSMLKGSVIAALSVGAASTAIAQSLPEMRITPTEIRASALDNNQIGSSGLPGVHTKVIFGDPSKAGFYTILLFVTAHTIQPTRTISIQRMTQLHQRRNKSCNRSVVKAANKFSTSLTYSVSVANSLCSEPDAPEWHL